MSLYPRLSPNLKVIEPKLGDWYMAAVEPEPGRVLVIRVPGPDVRAAMDGGDRKDWLFALGKALIAAGVPIVRGVES
jgi:hypothetical protein